MAVVALSQVHGCSKPGCTRKAPINRHHRAHEALWLSAWSARRSEPRVRELVRRYWEFREEDIVRLCIWHHAEIHWIYEGIIEADKVRTRRGLPDYSWTQQRRLSQQLRDACSTWLLEETPGIDPALYDRSKHTRRRSLRNKHKRARQPKVLAREDRQRRRRRKPRRR